MENSKAILITIFISLIIFTASNGIEANQTNDAKLKGVVYFSNGSELMKYDFSNKKKITLFTKSHEESNLNNAITDISYPAYLKSKDKMLFIGIKDVIADRVFESDLDLKNWREYTSTQGIGDLSISPDEKMVAYYRYPNKLVIRKYEDLGKEDSEKIVAENASTGGMPLWISNSEIIFHSKTNDIVKVDMNNGAQLILVKNLFPESISPDKNHMLCSNNDSIYLYDIATSQLKQLQKSMYLYHSSPCIWSPDGQYFIYSKGRKIGLTINVYEFINSLTAEIRDVYVYCPATGKEVKILDNERASFGGFWLDKDPNG